MPDPANVIDSLISQLHITVHSLLFAVSSLQAGRNALADGPYIPAEAVSVSILYTEKSMQ